MRAWIFIFVFAGLLIMAPSNAYKGGLIENDTDMGLVLAVVLIVLALFIRPTEEGWGRLSGPLGCGGWVMGLLMWGSVAIFALWLMAGAPNGGGL